MSTLLKFCVFKVLSLHTAWYLVDDPRGFFWLNESFWRPWVIRVLPRVATANSRSFTSTLGNRRWVTPSLRVPPFFTGSFFWSRNFSIWREKLENPRVSKRIKMMQRIRLFPKSGIWLLLILLAYVHYFNAFFWICGTQKREVRCHPLWKVVVPLSGKSFSQCACSLVESWGLEGMRQGSESQEGGNVPSSCVPRS